MTSPFVKRHFAHRFLSVMKKGRMTAKECLLRLKNCHAGVMSSCHEMK